MRPDASRQTSENTPVILYVCVHNAGRSQMAAAFTARLGKGRALVSSAGSAPAERVNPVAVLALAEPGIDMSNALPRPITDDAARAADVIVTMGCGDACAAYPGTLRLDWDVDDPADQPLEAVRRIRDDIRARVEALLVQLGVPPPAT